MKVLRLIAVVIAAAMICGADWRQFRGTDSTGVALGEAVPQSIGEKGNIAWKVDIPDRGPSSPIVVGDRVIVTSAGGPRRDRLHVLAYDAGQGTRLWQRSFWGTGPADCHPKISMAAPTPASDGRRIVALFSTDDLVCLDLEGNLQWVRSLYEENPGATDGRGLATSPIIVGSVAVVQIDNQNRSFAVGIDLATGANRWRLERPRQMNWSSPIALGGHGSEKALVLLQGTTGLTALEPATGKEVWALKRDCDPIASSVCVGNVMFVPGEKGLAAFALQGSQPPRLLWESLKLNPVMASPILLGDRVYSLRGSILATGNAQTGELLGQLRLKGPFSASMVASGGLLYCFSESGLGQVVKPGQGDGTLLSSGDLKETVLGTPAVANGALYLRTDKHLVKIAKKETPSSRTE
jgi:outer membrane protein assembly factor BamB